MEVDFELEGRLAHLRMIRLSPVGKFATIRERINAWRAQVNA
jgi:hypothetical protein